LDVGQPLPPSPKSQLTELAFNAQIALTKSFDGRKEEGWPGGQPSIEALRRD
jgi:hypothetical protein